MSFSSDRGRLITRLENGPESRQRFTDSHVSKGIASQIRAMRLRDGLSQAELGERIGMNQNAISRLESANYGKATVSTLKRVAAAFDVGLMVRFVPFSQLVDWISETPRTDYGLTTQALSVPSFEFESREGMFKALQDSSLPKPAPEQTAVAIETGVPQQNHRISYRRRDRQGVSRKTRFPTPIGPQHLAAQAAPAWANRGLNV